ncbi:putative O-linked N-acetylglucosamine transferase (SPINDLY family) [Halomonas alkaliantarctica]|nr:putative O-linked N-acetylglucosamine transferase (SPINDLY family) [Halomonas alkaliantarctica]
MSNKKPNRPSQNARQRTLGARGTAQALKKAKERTVQQPASVAAWKQLGAELSEAGQFQEALEALDRASSLVADDAETLALQGRITHQAGDPVRALAFLHSAIEINPKYAKAQHYIGYIYYTQARFDEALKHAEIACELMPGDVDMLNTLGNTLMQTFEYARARDALEKAVKLAPKNYLSWNNLGNVYNAIGDLDKGLESYWQAHRVNPQAPGPFSNIITTYHYHPNKTGEEITVLCKQWHRKYSPEVMIPLPRSTPIASKQLRIGLISDGFRGHPVGRMITSALEQVPKSQAEFYCYSTNNVNDGITERLKAVSEKWMSVQPLKDQQVAQQIANDEIDILIDLVGHNAGNRVLSVAMRPAPLQVKWVGGLINTTGVEAIDYLISDSIETPVGVDNDYVEKLIRLPDDYVCYVPPNGYEPSVRTLPAQRNGYITLGCFNNAAKLNDILLVQWAEIMTCLPGSKLLLKSMQYKSEERRQKIIDLMVMNGIEKERLLIEGPSPHAELLETYNRVDISLDPWPYSGGLTTCESLLMGVPVVSLPGPTFAGRHSATHLINVGMPELVVSSWEEYRERVLELASDLDSLATIRQHLRQVLLESPVCDAFRFAKHFTDAMRAIWQRHCEGKEPAALTFDKTGLAKFEDEEASVDVVYAESLEVEAAGFHWSLPSKIIALDNGSKLVVEKGIDTLRKLNSFGIVAFDPASQVINTERFEGSKDVQVFTHAVLGDGSSATLYSCLDPALSSTLEPMPVEQQYGANPAGASVLAKLPINTIALDSIEGLDSLDWLILDDLSDSAAILENGEKALKDTLVIQVRIAFQPTHKRQPNLTEIQHWMSRHGFRLYRFNNQQHLSHLPDSVPAEIRQATELQSVDAVFLPTHERLAELSENQITKLAFLLHTVYGIKDMAYSLLARVNEDKAEEYLIEEGLANKKLVPAMKREVIYDPNQLECNQREFTLCVGVPVYNEEKYIRETIQSLKNQDFENVRFLIADNCSTDDTLNIICEETAHDDRFEIFQQPKNIGASRNFEFLISNTKSKYFMWLGAHDVLSEKYLSLAVEEIDKTTDVAMVMGKPMAISKTSNLIGFVKDAVYDFTSNKREERYLKSVAELANCTVVHAVFVREALKDFEFRVTVSPDHVLISHLLWYGKLKNIDGASYFRRYFDARSESQANRVSGGEVKLDREDFFEYYLDDLNGLANESNYFLGKGFSNKIKGILKARFL